MATHVFTGDQYRRIDRKILDIKRMLNTREGSPLDPDRLEQALQRLVEGNFHGEPKGCSVDEARKIMGRKAFIGTFKVDAAFNLNESFSLAGPFGRVPFDRDTLEECANTHILVAGRPMSICDIASKQPKLFRVDNYWLTHTAGSFHSSGSFACFDKVEEGWHLVAKSALRGTMGLAINQQRDCIGSLDYIPPAVLIVYTMVLWHMFENNGRLFEECLVSTSSATTHGTPVVVGLFSSGGMLIRSWQGEPTHNIGLATARKSLVM